MDFQTPNGSKSFKFSTKNYQVEVLMNQFQEELKISMIELAKKDNYQTVLDQTSLPQDLKVFLNNIKTVYQYIELNKDNNEKIKFGETGKIHLIFMLSFGPLTQIKKEIILETQLIKAVVVDEDSNANEYFDILKEKIIQLNRKHDEDKKKMSSIVESIERSNKKLAVQTEAIKVQNTQFKKRISVAEEKVNSLEILLKNLYADVQEMKEQKVELETKVANISLNILPQFPDITFDYSSKKGTNSTFDSSLTQNSSNILKRIETLQYQRDSQKRIIEDNLVQKKKSLEKKVNQSQRNLFLNVQPERFQPRSPKIVTKDNDLQRLKNTVSPSISQGKKQKQKYYNFNDSKYISIVSISNKLGRKLGLTGKYYCGGKICHQKCLSCKGSCGPTSGQNCVQCMKLDLQRKCLKKGYLINGNGTVAWQQNSQFRCGTILDNKNSVKCGYHNIYCKWCSSLNKNYQHRYKSLI